MEKHLLGLFGLTGAAAIFALLAATSFLTINNHAETVMNQTLSDVKVTRSNLSNISMALKDVKSEVDTRATQASVNTTNSQLRPLAAQAIKAIIINNETGHEQVWLPLINGISYRGHATLNAKDYPICEQPNASCFPNHHNLCIAGPFIRFNFDNIYSAPSCFAGY